jgi:hypothetical protein
MRSGSGEKRMTDRAEALARFEPSLDAWVAQFEATTKSNDALWNRTFDLKRNAWNLRARNPRMKRLHQKLDSALNLLIGQAAQRQRFLKELRVIKNSN